MGRLMITIFRIQDEEGRGPFRPGFSEKWMRGEKPYYLSPPWIEAGISIQHYSKLLNANAYSGTGCKSMEKLCEWFSHEERAQLAIFGYHIVRIIPTRIVLNLTHQIVFECCQPLALIAEKNLII